MMNLGLLTSCLVLSIIPYSALSLKCKCSGSGCSAAEQANETCFVKPTNGSSGFCFKLRSETERDIEVSFGCFEDNFQTDLQCRTTLLEPQTGSTVKQKAMACCQDKDFCNKYLEPKFRTPPSDILEQEEVDEDQGYVTQYALLISVSVCLLVLVGAFAFLFVRYQRRKQDQRLLEDGAGESDVFIPSGRCINDLIEQSSGSGSGLPLLVQRTIAKQISLVQMVGKGRYGEVWRSKWRGEDVAVKVFFTTEEASWFRETELYQTVLLRHENILGFIAADIKGTGGWTQLFLVTDYHAPGSLYEYLQETTLSLQQGLILASSIICGLCHLHTEIHGTKGKPPIAHRDIKSKNILVKKNGTACIGDLGLAVKYDSLLGKIDIVPDIRQGTKRYMAPELLDETINKHNLDEFRQTDMYSFALVLWEICQRILYNNVVDEYKIPYYDCVESDPSFQQMKEVVCSKRIRPLIPIRCIANPAIQPLTEVIRECWNGNPMARLTSLRAKKTINRCLELNSETLKPIN